MESQVVELIDSGVPVLIDFYSLKCPACKFTAPAFAALNQTHGDKVKLIAAPLNKAPVLKERFNVTHVPTFIAIKDGKEQARLVGLVRATALEKLADSLNG